jgi:hypothetical protein
MNPKKRKMIDAQTMGILKTKTSISIFLKQRNINGTIILKINMIIMGTKISGLNFEVIDRIVIPSLK